MAGDVHGLKIHQRPKEHTRYAAQAVRSEPHEAIVAALQGGNVGEAGFYVAVGQLVVAAVDGGGAPTTPRRVGNTMGHGAGKGD